MPEKERFSFESPQITNISSHLGIRSDVIGVAQNGLWVHRDDRGILLEKSYYYSKYDFGLTSPVPARMVITAGKDIRVSIILDGKVLLIEVFPAGTCAKEG